MLLAIFLSIKWWEYKAFFTSCKTTKCSFSPSMWYTKNGTSIVERKKAKLTLEVHEFRSHYVYGWLTDWHAIFRSWNYTGTFGYTPAGTQTVSPYNEILTKFLQWQRQRIRTMLGETTKKHYCLLAAKQAYIQRPLFHPLFLPIFTFLVWVFLLLCVFFTLLDLS